MKQLKHIQFIAFTQLILLAVPLLAASQAADTRARIVELFQQAQQAEQADKLPSAAGFYKTIVAIDPNVAEVWSNLGMALYRQDKFEESIRAFERASALKPALLVPHLFAGMAYLKMGKGEMALGPLKSALLIEPNRRDAILALSEAYAKTRQFEASVRLLQEALKLDPDSESLGSNLAVTYLDWAKDVGNALRRSPGVYGKLLSSTIHAATGATTTVEDFRATVAFAPGSVEARLTLARFLMESQPTPVMLIESEEQIEAARKISPADLDVAAAEVRLAIARNDLSRALGLLQALTKEDPAFTLANLNSLASGLPAAFILEIEQRAANIAAGSTGSPGSYSSKFAALDRIKSKRMLTATEDAEYASAAWHLHRYDQALLELERRHRSDAASQYWTFRACKSQGRDVLVRTVNAHPDSVPSHLLLADFAIQREDYEEAKSEYRTAMALRPHDPEIMLLNIRMLETAREPQQAQEEATRAATEFPLHVGLNLEAGELMLRSAGDAEAAVKYLEQAVHSDPKMVRARVDLADAYAQLNKLDDAIHEINQIAATDDDGALHYRLARWYRQAGHPEEAAAALKLCKKLKQQTIERGSFVSSERSVKEARDPLQ